MATAKPRTFDDVLTKIRAECTNTRDLGDRFEQITKDFLLTDTQYKKRFDKVHLWKHWRYKAAISPSGGDIGVDLVGEERDGSLCAVQCKCYDDDGNLDFKTLGTFFTTAGLMEEKLNKKVNTILVYTGDRTTPNADNAINTNKCHVIGQSEFRDSSIIWDGFPKLKARKHHELRPHQKRAFDDVISGLETADRGKLIMACGTGKTLTSLRIAEKHAGIGSTVLYLVPSISLIHQTMREWSENGKIKHHYAVVCSDKTVGEDEDSDISQLAFPPTTDETELVRSFGKRSKDAMGVIFSTYHSIDVASKAIKKPFDLILCDEAHRTTGAEKDKGKELTHFVKVHHDRHVRGRKRLYMTATSRVYGEAVKSKADVHSMDDPEIYGEEFHNYSFGEAVSDGHLADFMVRIPVIPEEDLKQYTNDSIENNSDDGTIDERVLLAAIWHALNHNNKERRPLLQRVISFSNKIQASKQFAGVYDGDAPTQDEESYRKSLQGKEDDDRIREDRSFENTVQKYEKTSEYRTGNTVSVRHIDGAMRASIRNNKMRWLKDSGQDPNECRILSNARCLSEGVDVPALDAVIFLQPRKSKTDVVQSVGRVMRIAKGKKYGHVILPVVLPAGMTFEESLYGGNKVWKTVWQVLAALRSHDPNFANQINRVNLDRSLGGYSPDLENVEIVWMGSHNHLAVEHEMFGKLVTRMVEKVGDRAYFDEQSKDLGRKASETAAILWKSYNDGHPKIVRTVDSLCSGLRSIVNDTIDEKATITVLAQHHALKQIFDALFPEEFRLSNPVAIVLDGAIEKIGLQKELESFAGFYSNVRKEVSKFKTDDGRQSYIKKIYGNFMMGFDKKKQESHGIVYTPDEVIDFIIHSVQHVLKTEFKKSYASTDVNIFDPFTGTGAFIARLLESGLISDKTVLRTKYKRSIWANEISLLAYYVAAINIEVTYKRVSGPSKRLPFRNINFTDTFNHSPRYRLGSEHRRKTVKLDKVMVKVHENITRGNWSHIHVIMSNPPYSSHQANFDDQNPNIDYSELDKRISDTYISRGTKGNKNSIYDSYIRSLRWASDRIGKSGIMAFVTNASFIRSETAAGLRASLQEEFNEIWCFDLRGNQNTQGETSRKEGGKIFGSGSKSPVAITILIKNPEKQGCTIHYKDIGDYHTREEKLSMMQDLKSIDGIKDWQIIIPDRHNDWLDQRSLEFSMYCPIGSKDGKANKTSDIIFREYSLGIATHRDVWVYNHSRHQLLKNIQTHIDYCNRQDLTRLTLDKKQGSWSADLTSGIKKHGKLKLSSNKIRVALYRPFFKQYMYFDRMLNSARYRIPQFFPKKDSENLVICVPDKGKTGMFSTLITDITPDLHIIEQSQCFPLHVYDENGNKTPNITNTALQEYQQHYTDKKITREDIFYYIYGLLHHSDYKEKFANNLSKELPHIPMAPDFWTFSKAGRKLTNLHLNYETCRRYKLGKPKVKFGKLEKMAYSRITNKDGKQIQDKTRLKINREEVYDNIPLTDYQVNGRTPLEWLIDRYRTRTDKDSGITNDPTDGMTEQKTIEMIERILYVSVESDKIIDELSKLPFEPENWEPRKTGMDQFIEDSASQTRL